jgi:hypothetical protein
MVTLPAVSVAVVQVAGVPAPPSSFLSLHVTIMLSASSSRNSVFIINDVVKLSGTLILPRLKLIVLTGFR